MATTLLPRGAHAANEPWSDADGVTPAERAPLGRYGLTLGAELRAQASHLDELDLTSTELQLIEHRLRADVALDDGDRLRLVVSVDALDGVPWGATRGAASARLGPPQTGIGVLDVDYVGPGPRDAPTAYGLTLRPAEAVSVRRAYGEATLPWGRLRFGRQPDVEGTTLLGADGDGRANRFGVDHGDDVVDRIELRLRPLVPLTGAADADDRGLGLSLAYDRLGLEAAPGDVWHRAGGTLRLLVVWPTREEVFDLRASARQTFRGNGAERRSELEGLVAIRVAELGLGFDGVLLEGQSSSEAESLAPLVGERPAAGRIRGWATRSVLRWDTSLATAYLELDTASGDSDPTPHSTLTRIAFPRDANVGLLLFEHVLAYATARAAAATDARLAAEGLPRGAADALPSRGAFTSAVALFPQVDLRPHRAWLLRGGLLFAWAPEPLVDPVRTLEDGAATPVNVRGGAGGSYFGTEVAARARYAYRERCLFDLEAAVLDPGDALADAQGEAANATLVAVRTTLAF